MRIRVDSQRIKSERDRRAWSQAHLAKAAGLGLRTVQRIEKSGIASGESLKALASVFSLELAELRIDEAAANLDAPLEPELNGSKEGLFWFVLFSSFGVFVGTALYGLFADGFGIEPTELGRAMFVALFTFFCASVIVALVQLFQRMREQSAAGS